MKQFLSQTQGLFLNYFLNITLENTATNILNQVIIPEQGIIV